MSGIVRTILLMLGVVNLAATVVASGLAMERGGLVVAATVFFAGLTSAAFLAGFSVVIALLERIASNAATADDAAENSESEPDTWRIVGTDSAGRKVEKTLRCPEAQVRSVAAGQGIKVLSFSPSI